MFPRKPTCIVILILCTGVWLLSRIATAGDQPAPELKKQVEKLVQQLASTDSAKEAAAAAALLKLGPAILPHLPAPDAKLAAEQKKQVEDIRRTLQDAQARKELGPRLITMHRPTSSLQEVLAELTKQTGNKVDDRSEAKDAQAGIMLDMDKLSFWQALDTIAKEADMRVVLHHRDSPVALMDGPFREVPVSYDGIFRTTVNRIDVTQDFRTEMHNLVVHLEVAWEPRFQPLFLDMPPDELVAHDDKGKELMIPDGGKGRVPVGRPAAVDIPIRVEAPRRAADKIGLLKGAVSVIGPTKMLNFAFDKLGSSEGGKPATARAETREGVTVTLREFRAEPERWTAVIMLEYPPDAPDFESFESWLVNNEIYLEKDKMRIPANGGYEIDDQAGHRAVMTYRFIEDEKVTLGKPGDWKLVYRTAGTIVKVPVRFEFKDLPLP